MDKTNIKINNKTSKKMNLNIDNNVNNNNKTIDWHKDFKNLWFNF